VASAFRLKSGEATSAPRRLGLTRGKMRFRRVS
jgi:hypothetical protein